MDNQSIYITTMSGRRFFYDDIEASEVAINDIAHSLARLVRYCGHVNTANSIYSVGQHSVLVAQFVFQRPISGKMRWLPLAALLHDAPEYVIGDMPGPLKKWLRNNSGIFDKLEQEIAHHIERVYELPVDAFEHPVIKHADLAIRHNEANAFCSGAKNLCAVTDHNTDGIGPLDIEPMRVWSIDETYNQFITAFLNYEALIKSEHLTST